MKIKNEFKMKPNLKIRIYVIGPLLLAFLFLCNLGSTVHIGMQEELIPVN